MSPIASVKLGANTVPKRVFGLSKDEVEQLEQDTAKCKWFSIQCDESVVLSYTPQQVAFVLMVFDDFSTKEEFLTLPPLKTTTTGVDIYNALKVYFVEKNIPVENPVPVTTGGALAMVSSTD